MHELQLIRKQLTSTGILFELYNAGSYYILNTQLFGRCVSTTTHYTLRVALRAYYDAVNA